jgi:hypothetical protein
MNVGNVLAVIIGTTIITTLGAVNPMLQQLTYGKVSMQDFVSDPKAPVAISGENIYVAWWTNKTANNNEEVMFRASTDGDSTFGDKINLSNTTNADSWRVEIAGEGPNVLVSWWETNETSDVPVAKISTDNGATFGPMLMLATNGTIGEAEEEQEEGE